MDIKIIIILIMWCCMSLLILVQCAPQFKGLPKEDIFAVITILFIGGPFFIISNILEAILDLIIPDGWKDDEDDFKRY